MCSKFSRSHAAGSLTSLPRPSLPMHTGRFRLARCHECSEGRTAPETTKPTDESLSSVGFFFVGGTAALHAAF